MTRLQTIVIAASVVLFTLLYFGFDTKPRERAEIDATRRQNAVQTDIAALLAVARENLESDQLALLGSMHQMLNQTEADSMKISVWKQISSTWYGYGRPDLAGHYAELIAQTTNTSEAWSIAGTTYAIGGQRLGEEKQRIFATEHAVAAFENAISLEPDNLNHRINLAVCYVDNPPAEQPMKGVQMLLNLDKKYPDAIGVQNTLARFAIKTGQFGKAAGRLEKVLSLDPENLNATCLIAKAYEGLGLLDKATNFTQRCEALTKQ